MDFTADMFTPITTQVESVITLVIPVAIGLFAIGLGLKYGKRVIGLFR